MTAAAELILLARLLRERNELDERIADLIGRPMVSGHAGEWIAAQIFEIALEQNAANPAYDGRFTSGELSGGTVNIKWYLKQESLLDMSISPTPDYYLVMTGPRPGSLGPPIRPWVIDAVHVFSAAALLAERQARGVKIGVATSVPQSMWRAAEIYPGGTEPLMSLSSEQIQLLRLFSATS